MGEEEEGKRRKGKGRRKEEVRTMRAKWWFYKGSNIIGEGRSEDLEKRRKKRRKNREEGK